MKMPLHDEQKKTNEHSNNSSETREAFISNNIEAAVPRVVAPTVFLNPPYFYRG